MNLLDGPRTRSHEVVNRLLAHKSLSDDKSRI